MTFDVDPAAGMLVGNGGPRPIPVRTATAGLVVEVRRDGFVGAVVACSEREVSLRDRRGRQRRFSNSPGAFLVDDQPVTLVAPTTQRDRPVGPSTTSPSTTNSGSVAAATPARVARAGRILVEGLHDAELIEQVWGDDLRLEGVVVQPLHGADDLAAVVRRFAPAPGRRLGVLLDHLVTGTKESRIADDVQRSHDVLITGHPYVDIWAAVRPQALGIDAWPDIPRGQPWKQGIAHHLGAADVHDAWRQIRSSVRTWRDLERDLIRAVERLIDFVTEDG